MTVDVMMQSSTLFTELDSPSVGGNGPEDERALQIALELSNLGLLANYDDDSSSYDEISKTSQNMTECVPVPSSEHVAEIVGRQGCKIKALRAKTNTYIKTPVRGEEPVFVVTGRKEDVAMARREVQSAAEHFTQIRASRNRHALLASQALGSINGEGAAGTITLQVRVPYRVVGLVVGPKGATIKRIQQQTHTYIVTPSRDKEPVFEVTGLPENVDKAKEEIEAHIASRTGSHHTSIDDDFKNNGTEVGSSSLNSVLMKSAFNTLSATSAAVPRTQSSALRSAAPNFFPMAAPNQGLNHPRTPMMVNSLDMLGFADCKFQPVQNGAHHHQQQQAENFNISWNMGKGPNLDMMNQGQFPSFLSGGANGGGSISSNSSSVNPHSRLSPTLSDPEYPPAFSPLMLPAQSGSLHMPVRRVGSEESTTSSVLSMDFSNLLSPTTNYAPSHNVNIESGYSSSGTSSDSISGSPVTEMDPLGLESTSKRRCVLCNETSFAALVPCGNHLLCYSCANDIVSQ